MWLDLQTKIEILFIYKATLYLFLSLSEDTTLLSVSLWKVYIICLWLPILSPTTHILYMPIRKIIIKVAVKQVAENPAVLAN